MNQDRRVLYALHFVYVTYYVSENASPSSAPAKTGLFVTSAARDFTVKVDVCGLSPQTRYYYSFAVGKVPSAVGTFKLPAAPGNKQESLKYAIFSCSNWPSGYFNVYDQASSYPLDFWMHVGDFIYESGVTEGAATTSIRFQEPPAGLQPQSEILSRSDYRRRYATYRQDPALQKLASAAPHIHIWDDHEITNDWYCCGADNHQPNEGDWLERLQRGIQVFYEWMPVRETRQADYTPSNAEFPNGVRIPVRDGPFNDPTRRFYDLERSFQFGDLATLIVTEDRVRRYPQYAGWGGSSNALDTGTQYNRSLSIQSLVNSSSIDSWKTDGTEAKLLAYREMTEKLRNNPNATMFGDDQFAFIEKIIRSSVANGTQWQLVGTQSLVLDWYWADLEAAIQQVRASGDEVTAAMWQQALYNITHPNNTYIQSSNAASMRYTKGTAQPVTPSVLLDGMAMVALGRYKINWWWDNWAGYQADRNRFLDILSLAPNAIVYSGDLHTSHAGLLKHNNKTVAAEFMGPGVTSTLFVDGQYGYVPSRMLETGLLLSNPGMRYANVRDKGFMLATLTHEKQHMEYIYADVSTPSYVGSCEVAFDYYSTDAAQSAGQSGVSASSVNPSNRAFVPAPSSAPGTLNREFVPSICDPIPPQRLADKVPATKFGQSSSELPPGGEPWGSRRPSRRAAGQ
ncbi:hypothetical protein WJX72_002906 [[Myrmecia] bisecta]|uniref:Uncharacterized protein n=1 Tax=[Myrmecia] bisecta TaxID=41462 RepID=A0AAW1PU28_9CHLO